MQPAADGPDDLDQSPLDRHVDVFVASTNANRPCANSCRTTSSPSSSAVRSSSARIPRAASIFACAREPQCPAATAAGHTRRRCSSARSRDVGARGSGTSRLAVYGLHGASRRTLTGGPARAAERASEAICRRALEVGSRRARELESRRAWEPEAREAGSRSVRAVGAGGSGRRWRREVEVSQRSGAEGMGAVEAAEGGEWKHPRGHSPRHLREERQSA